MNGFTVRPASERDLPAPTDLIRRSIGALPAGFLTPDQVTASRAVMGLDTQLVRDGTYFMVENGAQVVGCGGWSRCATLYGGDHSTGLRDAALLDPACDPARIRAMYTHPDFARRGIGRRVLAHCERAAAAAGYRRVELMGTMSGEPLYRACGYREIERTATPPIDAISVPMVRMGKPLATACGRTFHQRRRAS